MNDIRIVFLDIDGTSYQNEIHDAPASTKLAFQKLKQQGVKLAVCTSRTYEEMAKLPADYRAAMDLVVCSNGARILTRTADRMRRMNRDETRQVIACLDRLHLTYRYEDEHGHGYLNEDAPDKSAIFRRLYSLVPPVKRYEGERLIHLLFYTTDPAVLAQIAACSPHETLIHFAGMVNELTQKGVSKASGMRRACQLLGLRMDQAAAFGDNGNDASMLKAAGIGVAMGNSDETCRQAADYVTARIEEDGLYQACVHYGWIRP